VSRIIADLKLYGELVYEPRVQSSRSTLSPRLNEVVAGGEDVRIPTSKRPSRDPRRTRVLVLDLPLPFLRTRVLVIVDRPKRPKTRTM
jgi:hypothetical protein